MIFIESSSALKQKTTLEESLYDEMKRTHFVGQKNNKMESHCFVPNNAYIY